MVPSRLQLTLHAGRRPSHGTSRLVLAIMSVKTRRAPSRHGRDARVYGHMTMAMHVSTIVPPPPKKKKMLTRRSSALLVAYCLLVYAFYNGGSILPGMRLFP